MLQYKVPQNVEMEDRIIGPITLRQLIILAVGGGIAYMLYLSLAPRYFAEVWLPPVALIVLLTAAIAFLKIQHIPFVRWVLLMIEAVALPRRRAWDKRASVRAFFASVQHLARRKGAAKKEATTKKAGPAANKTPAQVAQEIDGIFASKPPPMLADAPLPPAKKGDDASLSQP